MGLHDGAERGVRDGLQLGVDRLPLAVNERVGAPPWNTADDNALLGPSRPSRKERLVKATGQIAFLSTQQ